jgi:integrase
MARKRRGRGEGAIFRRADGVWTCSVSLGYDEHGKRKRRTFYGASKQEVQEKLRKAQADYALGHLTDADQFTAGDWLTLWLENTARVKVSPTTYDRYKLVIDNKIKPHLGAVRLNKLTTFHVSQLDGILERAGESPRQRQMAVTVLHTALREAVRMKFLAANPCTDATRPKVAKKEMKVYDPGQVRQFLEAALADRLHALYVLAIDTGMRMGELFAVQWPDVDFAAGTVQVQRTLEELRGQHRLKPPKTAAGRRRIDLAAFTLDALNEHRKRMLAEGHDVKTGLVFVDEKGGFLRKSNVSRRSFRSVMQRAKLPRLRFHDLRHTSASLLLMAGENPKVAQERLGHEKIEVTLDTYSHVLPTMQKGAARKLDGIFTARPEGNSQAAGGGA